MKNASQQPPSHLERQTRPRWAEQFFCLRTRISILLGVSAFAHQHTVAAKTVAIKLIEVEGWASEIIEINQQNQERTYQDYGIDCKLKREIETLR